MVALCRKQAWARPMSFGSMRPTSLAVPAGHAPSVACGKPMTEAMGEAATKTVREAVVEMVEALHDDDRGGEAEKPRSVRPTPIRIPCPIPRRGEVGIGIRRGVRGIGRRRNLVDLRRQSWRGLGDPPAPVGLFGVLAHPL